jgi:hypothetical protein
MFISIFINCLKNISLEYYRMKHVCGICQRQIANMKIKKYRWGLFKVCVDEADVEICNKIVEDEGGFYKKKPIMQEQARMRFGGAKLIKCDCGRGFHTFFPLRTAETPSALCPFCNLEHFAEPNDPLKMYEKRIIEDSSGNANKIGFIYTACKILRNGDLATGLYVGSQSNITNT